MTEILDRLRHAIEDCATDLDNATDAADVIASAHRLDVLIEVAEWTTDIHDASQVDGALS